MRTKEEAEATLAKLPLARAVAVADTTAKDGTARRVYAFTLPAGNECTIEIDAEPSEQQLADLARHLPLVDKDWAAAFEVLKSPAATVEATDAKVVSL